MSEQGTNKDLLVGVTATTPSHSTSTVSTAPASDETAAIREGIERTRGEMSRTVNQIEERLSPARIEEQVAELKESVLGNYHEVKDHLKDDISRELREAKDKVKEEILDVKDRVQGEINHARTAVHDATFGRVENMVQDARHMVHDARETVTDAGSSVLDTIKANPVPAALMAVGLGWLIMSARKSSVQTHVGTRRLYAGTYDDESRYGYGGSYGASYGAGYEQDRLGGPRRALRQGQRAVGSALHDAEEGVANVGHRVQQGASHLAGQASGVAHDIGERAGNVAHDIGERAGALAHDVGERVQHLGDDAAHYAHEARIRSQQAVRRASRQVRRVERSFEGTLRENPLAVGAVALAVGASIGLLLPSTRREDEWMGTVKDQLVDRAEHLAGDALTQVEANVTGQLGNGEEQGMSGHEGKNGLSNGISKNEKSKSSSI